MSHQDPVVMEGSGSTTVVEDSGIVCKQLLKCLQMTWISLRREGSGSGWSYSTPHTAYRWYSSKQCLLLYTPETVVECHCHHSWVDTPDRFHCKPVYTHRQTDIQFVYPHTTAPSIRLLGYLRLIKQGIPSLLHLPQGESTGELHP